MSSTFPLFCSLQTSKRSRNLFMDTLFMLYFSLAALGLSARFVKDILALQLSNIYTRLFPFIVIYEIHKHQAKAFCAVLWVIYQPRATCCALHHPHQSGEGDQPTLSLHLSMTISFSRSTWLPEGPWLPGGPPLTSSTVTTDRNPAINLPFAAVCITVM